MRVLIPCDTELNNNFVLDLVNSLENNNCIVEHGTNKINEESGNWDIVNFQWPEFLFKGAIPDDDLLKNFEHKLLNIRKNSSIVSTIHNLKPHYPYKTYQKLYKLVYKYSDGFIHFGYQSIKSIHNEYFEEVKDKPHTVISHGNYESIIDKKNFSNHKNSNSTKPKVLILGTTRNLEEINIIKAAFKSIKSLGGEINYVGKIRLTSKAIAFKSWKLFIKEIYKQFIGYLRFLTIFGLNYHLRSVSNQELNFLLNKSNILFIPRVKNLNSGNIALGFTAGLTVIGPEIGNIGEILKASNNPTYSISNFRSSITKAFKNGLEIIKNGTNEKNIKVAREEWKWSKLSEEYIRFYKELISKNNNTQI